MPFSDAHHHVELRELEPDRRVRATCTVCGNTRMWTVGPQQRDPRFRRLTIAAYAALVRCDSVFCRMHPEKRQPPRVEVCHGYVPYMCANPTERRELPPKPHGYGSRVGKH